MRRDLADGVGWPIVWHGAHRSCGNTLAPIRSSFVTSFTPRTLNRMAARPPQLATQSARRSGPATASPGRCSAACCARSLRRGAPAARSAAAARRTCGRSASRLRRHCRRWRTAPPGVALIGHLSAPGTAFHATHRLAIRRLAHLEPFVDAAETGVSKRGAPDGHPIRASQGPTLGPIRKRSFLVGSTPPGHASQLIRGARACPARHRRMLRSDGDEPSGRRR